MPGLIDKRFRPNRSEARCRCKGKGTCLDCQRWERIFKMKFEDQTYYNNLIIRWDSTFPQRHQN